MSKQKVTSLLGFIVAILSLHSCAVPSYLPGPTIHYPGIQNTCTFGVQNMDEKAKVEPNALTAHYNGFDVTYKINANFVVSLTIINNSNKSLIIDKSKSYVLYDGYLHNCLRMSVLQGALPLTMFRTLLIMSRPTSLEFP